MEILMYLCLGALVYLIGSGIIIYVTVNKVISFFKDNPSGLPNRLPEDVQEFKESIGEDKFQELYDDYWRANK